MPLSTRRGWDSTQLIGEARAVGMAAWWRRGEPHIARGRPAATMRALDTCRRARRRSDGWGEGWICHAAVVVGLLRQKVISSQIGSDDVGTTVCFYAKCGEMQR